MNKHIEYIFDEIDLRVESLKCELNNLADEIKTELVCIKDSFTKKMYGMYRESEFDFAELQNILEE